MITSLSLNELIEFNYPHSKKKKTKKTPTVNVPEIPGVIWPHHNSIFAKL